MWNRNFEQQFFFCLVLAVKKTFWKMSSKRINEYLQEIKNLRGFFGGGGSVC